MCKYFFETLSIYLTNRKPENEIKDLEEDAVTERNYQSNDPIGSSGKLEDASMQMDVDVANQLMEPDKTEGEDDKANEETEEEGPQGWLLGRIWRTYNRPMIVVLGL